MRASIMAAAAAVLAFSSPATANIVTNGGFETGDFTGWTQVNDTSFTGVDGTFGGVAPPEGVFQAFFGPVDPGGGGIVQTLTTVAGADYDISFLLANLGDPPNAFGLFWDGGFVSIDFDLEPFDYQEGSTTLTASGTSTDIGFIFYHLPSFFLLDDISVDLADAGAVPEPATWAMMIAGFGLTGAAMRRRNTRTTVSYA